MDDKEAAKHSKHVWATPDTTSPRVWNTYAFGQGANNKCFVLGQYATEADAKEARDHISENETFQKLCKEGVFSSDNQPEIHLECDYQCYLKGTPVHAPSVATA